MDLEELLRNPHSRNRLELLKKHSKKTQHLTHEQLLLKGIQLIAFSKSNLFRQVEN